MKIGIGGPGEYWPEVKALIESSAEGGAEQAGVIENVRGVIVRWMEKGFGFIRLTEGGNGRMRDVFVHHSALCVHLRERFKGVLMRQIGLNVEVMVGWVRPDPYQESKARAEGVSCFECEIRGLSPSSTEELENTADYVDSVFDRAASSGNSEVRFSEDPGGKRWFLCQRSHALRMATADYKRYQAGEAVELECSHCPGGAKGTVQKE